jgi:hypothetical protein
MSDFYQILKREIEPRQPSDGEIELDKELDEKNKTVDKISDFLPDQKKKKNNKRKETGKTKIISRKKTIPSLQITKYASQNSFLSTEPDNPIWLTMAETAKLGGVQKRTVKRALRAGLIKYRIVESRYQVDFRSALIYLFSKNKLWNKVKKFGIGQYVEKWKN